MGQGHHFLASFNEMTALLEYYDLLSLSTSYGMQKQITLKPNLVSVETSIISIR